MKTLPSKSDSCCVSAELLCFLVFSRAIVDSDGREIAINMNRGTFTFITAIQDETHRFANAYRKQQMKQKSYSSTLTEVPGVGPKIAKALLAQFKSVGAVKEATPDQLENTPGVGKQLAQTIYDYFHQAWKRGGFCYEGRYLSVFRSISPLA